MDNIIFILLIIATVKFIIFGAILFAVFRPNVKLGRTAKEKKQLYPTCIYCESRYTKPVDEGQTRWDGSDLVLVTTFECQHCHLPFWTVERVPTGSLKS